MFRAEHWFIVYSSGKLTGFTSIDAAVATLTYNNGSGTLLSSIASRSKRGHS